MAICNEKFKLIAIALVPVVVIAQTAFKVRRFGELR